jgi:hypothetical protein
VGRSAGSVPTTVVGHWLVATWQQDNARRRTLSARLNNGHGAGWNDDEPSVARIACELTLPEYFPAGHDVRAVTAFARELVPAMSDRYNLNVLQVEAILRSCLGDTEVDLSGIKPNELFVVHVISVGLAMARLGYDRAAMQRVARQAELIALGKGIPLPVLDAR